MAWLIGSETSLEMTLSDLLPPERVRAIAQAAWVSDWETQDELCDALLTIAAPEIARAVLRMAAKRLEMKAAELEVALQTTEIMLIRAVRISDAAALVQMAEKGLGERVK